MHSVWLKKKIIWLACTAFILGTASYFYRTNDQQYLNDFSVFYRASVRFTQSDWTGIYSAADGPYPFRYTPPVLLAIGWMHWFPENIARLIWFSMQVIFFALGFLSIRRVLSRTLSRNIDFELALASLMVVKYYLDSLVCGQISGFMFAGYCWTIEFWILGLNAISMASLLTLTLTKLGPGLSFFALLVENKITSWIKILRAPILLFLFFNLLLALFAVSFRAVVTLWLSWYRLIFTSQDYYEAAITKNQSLKGFLFRFANQGVIITQDQARLIWVILTIATSSLIIYHWKKNLKGPLTLALTRLKLLSISIIAYLLFMPETLPYSMVFMFFPIVGILCEKKEWVDWIALVVVLAACSLPGSDIIGSENSEWLNVHSIPFFCMAFLGCVLFFRTRSLTTAK